MASIHDLHMLSSPALLWVPEDPTVKPPYKKHHDDSGYDLHAWKFLKAMVSDLGGFATTEVLADAEGAIAGIGTADQVIINPGERLMVSTGFQAVVQSSVELPSWLRFGISIVSRSGTPYKEGLVVANQPGTVDVGYRGPIIVALLNAGKSAITVNRGDRIAQLLIRPVILPLLVQVDSLPPAERGDKGFGSSGKN